MPLHPDLQRVLVIGSGPIVIGQAAEFDYSGTQAIAALKEEGLTVILVNPNPATIMTDRDLADRTYLEPLTVDVLETIIARERPDGLLPTLGGQTALNLATALHDAGVLEAYGVRLLGTSLETIRQAEDRGAFKALMTAIDEPVLPSTTVTDVDEALKAAAAIGYPVIVRPAYTLGGSGGGHAETPEALRAIAARALRLSPIHQALIEKSIYGWKEIEYEVVRDGAGGRVIVTGMENVDPVGVHTGDSIVVAPVQTLSAEAARRLEAAAERIIDALDVRGACNIQFALSPDEKAYAVIEVNPRVSRSSALASKATGYPIARVAAKVAVGLTLAEIRDRRTGRPFADRPPAIDHVTVKVPRFPFEKFPETARRLGPEMQATGEVMAVGRSFPEALMKAIRSLEVGRDGLLDPELASLSDRALAERIRTPGDDRLWAMAEALRRGMTPAAVAELSAVARPFVEAIADIVAVEGRLRAAQGALSPALLADAKRLGFPDAAIARLTGLSPEAVAALRRAHGIRPVFRTIGDCRRDGFGPPAAYRYGTYGEARPEEAKKAAGSGARSEAAGAIAARRSDSADGQGATGEGAEAREAASTPAVVVLGSGPIRIGQGIEFDYSAVHAAWALREEGFAAIMVNNNPETVSTDTDVSDRLYVEPLWPEDVLEVLDAEAPRVAGVLTQFGGQTAIHLLEPLARAGRPLLGTAPDGVDRAEDRRRFDALLAALGLRRPPGRTVFDAEEAIRAAQALGYPLLVRPSYVLGGRAMEIVPSEAALRRYLRAALAIAGQRPILLDRYFPGVELEVDALSDGEAVVVAGILRHLERAGVHSGDSTAVFPAGLEAPVRRAIVETTGRLALALGVRGLLNVQYVLYEGALYVLEVNVRASRTVPVLAKAAGLPLARLAARIAVGRSLAELGLDPPADGTVPLAAIGPDGRPKRGVAWLWPEPPDVYVKLPVFSWAKLARADVRLGPEMRSTGEVLGRGRTVHEALYKAIRAAGFDVPFSGVVALDFSAADPKEAVPYGRRLSGLGFRLVAAGETAAALKAAAVPVAETTEAGLLAGIADGSIDLVASPVPPEAAGARSGPAEETPGYAVRRRAADLGLPLIVDLDFLGAYVDMLAALDGRPPRDVLPLQAWPLPSPKLPLR
ncbi:MAG: carbamoyl-phosphate synthase large subunit [Hydrogenibacillus schlegelii]|nr:carbamoyl-phosphate synthase large subunit [Hydrogenibacillus schlegelii]